jgi:hypothetical protein
VSVAVDISSVLQNLWMISCADSVCVIRSK